MPRTARHPMYNKSFDLSIEMDHLDRRAAQERWALITAMSIVRKQGGPNAPISEAEATRAANAIQKVMKDRFDSPQSRRVTEALRG